MHRHNLAVGEISKQVKFFHERQIPFRIYHGSTNSTRPQNFDRDAIIDTSALCNTIEINKEKCTALVEPKVSMAQLVRDSLTMSMIPAVVPEFPNITAGGAYAGTAGESSSFKYGYFDKSVKWVEMVLGDGKVVRASQEESPSLFHGSAGAMGTLGVITLLEVQLVPCGQYLRVDYHPVSTAHKAVDMIQSMDDDGIDFLDGIMFSENIGMIITAKVILDKPKGLPIVGFTKAKDRWFFTHVHGKLRCPKDLVCLTCHWTKKSFQYKQKDKVMSELVPVHDYLFRYDRGSFWLGCYGFAPNLWNRITRRLFNAIFKTEFGYKVLHLANTGQRCIIQDLAIPEDRTVEFLQFLEARLKIYPLWLCPIKHSNETLMHTPLTQTSEPKCLINIGVWGQPDLGERQYTKDTFDRFEDDNRAIEDKLAETGGLKWLYAQNFYTEKKFWSIYDKQRYDTLRKEWKATTLPTVWDKVQRNHKEWEEVHFVRALISAALGKKHLL